MEYKNESRQCQNCKNEFVIDQEDFNFYKKIKVPPPTFCPLCRAQRRFAFRNERRLFKVKDYFSSEEIFSLTPKESGLRVITQNEWFGDNWDGLEYGQVYDFSKSFFEQIFFLFKKVPFPGLFVNRMVDSPYSGNSTALKNSYLCFNSTESENCMYSNAIDLSKDCIDNSHVNHSERCYESFWLQNCYQCYFSIMCSDSRNLYFCRDCLGCSDCIGCVALRKSSYCIFNKQYTKERYFEELEKMKFQTVSGVKKIKTLARDFWLNYPVRSHQGIKNLDCTGSYVTNSKNVKDSYLIRGGENMHYCQYMQVISNKDNYDTCIWGFNTELSYETCESGDNTYNNKFGWKAWADSKNVEYCIDIVNCSDCFGCVGLRKKQYCILNKQYSKEEYEKLVEQIKKHMNDVPYVDSQGIVYKYGEFFPIKFSPYGYNNSLAMQHFPLTKEEAKEKGYQWIEISRGEYKITKKTNELPDSIQEVKESILKEIIECENCKFAFRILENELIFYKKEKLPLPTFCPDCRFEERIKDRLSIKLYKRSCMCAGVEDDTKKYLNTVEHFHKGKHCEEIFKTGYSSDSGEIVYCEKCYQQEVY